MNKSKKTINRLFLLMIMIYLALLLCISSIAVYYSYEEKKKEILATLDQSIAYCDQEYTSITQNFWQAYLPIFEDKSFLQQVLQNYFSFTEAKDLTPQEKKDLIQVLHQMKARDSKIQWIGLYSDNRKINYMLPGGNLGLTEIDTDFPYLDEIHKKSVQMEIYGAKEYPYPANSMTFAICGGVPKGMGEGKIIIGYSLSAFEKISSFSIPGIPSVKIYMTSQDQLLYDSSGTYDITNLFIPENYSEGIHTFHRQRIFVKSILTGTNTSVLSYSLTNKELILAAHRDTPFILSITVLFTFISVLVHFFMDRSVKKEISVIRAGLDAIADENYEYHLPVDFTHIGDLPQIAQNINTISDKLNENIKKAYYFELKQKDAQLAELQSTFNPHFLYNTLEMLRSKSYSNGDEETSILIAQLSALFRGFINAKTFITLKEELAFSNRYLSLLNERYGHQVHVDYNIPSELLNYGIIRNVFQLLIENYFVHGFDTSKEDNFIYFRGESLDDTTMVLRMEDNGTGMDNAELASLNARIEQPIRHNEKSYGLKNLNQRIKLFYGPDFGIHLSSGKQGGLLVEIVLQKITVDEYESKRRKDL